MAIFCNCQKYILKFIALLKSYERLEWSFHFETLSMFIYLETFSCLSLVDNSAFKPTQVEVDEYRQILVRFTVLEILIF